MILVNFTSEQDGLIFGSAPTGGSGGALPYALRGLTLEPFKQSLIDALELYLPDTLVLADNNPELNGPIGLPQPQSYSMATSIDYTLTQVWPAIVVIGKGMDAVGGGEQKQTGKYRGRIGVIAYLKDQDDDRLARTLDRFGDAMWRALQQRDSYAKWQIDTRTVTILISEPPKQNAFARGAGVFFEGYTYG